ncbi:PucR family transcriptional regulator [Nocardioides alcanivorans]|uniref:PucR family transcriptional regulator n=1 Tax=Nocardioides alcanivorans TaxID=2897352 RepID=UPI001F367B59|nr:helix-turn-helix domain-containing protein [Nocardioides alcanivorans]
MKDEALRTLARADQLHQALTHLVLEGGDLEQIAAEVARTLECEVCFTTPDGREQAAHLSLETREVLIDAELVDPTGRIRVERLRSDGSQVGVGQIRHFGVGAAGVDLARLLAYDPTGPIADADVQALERAAIVAALLITREEAITAVENKYRGDFLRELFLRRADDLGYISEHAEAFGWNLDRPVVVCVAELDPEGLEGEHPSSERRRNFQARFANAWRQVCRGIDQQIPAVDFSSEVVTLLPVADIEETPSGRSVVLRAAKGVHGDRGGGRLPFSVGVSRVAPTMAQLPEAYKQARRAVEIGRRVRGGASTTYFDQLGLHRLLALVPDPAELSAYAKDVLGPLAERTPEAADLRETLRVLLDTNFNVAEAARAQFFHYNTMRYRVGKLQRLLGPLATDPHLRLDVAVALRVLEIAE